MKPMVIGLTDCSKFNLYNEWILAGDPGVSTVRISWKNPDAGQLGLCDGILLTGGEDVHPRFYNCPEYYKYCYSDDICEERDELEMKVLEYSQSRHLPVLGICRGLQIANVFFGGTLLPDLPAWGKFNHSKYPDGADRYHSVTVDPDSLLFRIVDQTSGKINSNHHQAVEKVGSGLVAAALSADGVVEALERLDPAAGAFLSLVQWHPERMTDQNSPFAKNIRETFLKACTK